MYKNYTMLFFFLFFFKFLPTHTLVHITPKHFTGDIALPLICVAIMSNTDQLKKFAVIITLEETHVLLTRHLSTQG